MYDKDIVLINKHCELYHISREGVAGEGGEGGIGGEGEEGGGGADILYLNLVC